MTRQMRRRLETYVGPQTRTAILPTVHDLLIVLCMFVVVADLYIFAGLVR